MAKKFSLAYLTIPGVNPMDQIRIAKECGYDYVSLRTIPMHLPGEPEFLLDKDPELFEATKKALKEYDMPLMDIELARVRPDLDIDEYEPAFEKAAELGGTDVLGSIWTRDKAFYIEKVGKICEMAKKYGLKYNVEFLPWAGVRNLQEAITLVDTVGADNLYIMVDTLHAGRAGVTGAELARKYHENNDVIHCIMAHHNDVEPQTVEAVLVQAADAISAARPGARRESLENYIKRLTKLEEIANSFSGVDKCFAIQSGREVRIMVKPEDVTDEGTKVLAKEIAKRIEKEMEYPGQIRVNVIRETRCTEYAK